MNYNGDLVKARFLADAGARTALVLLRDRDVTYFEQFDGPVSSTQLGFSEEELGGRFVVRLEKLDEIYQGEGSYGTVVCDGYSGRQSARTAVSIKFASPLTNFAIMSNGNFQIKGFQNPEINGPIFVNANGDSGDLTIWHQRVHVDPTTGLDNHVGGDVKIGGDLQASGDIVVQNKHYAGDGPAQRLDGPISAGSIQSSLPGVPNIGRVSFTRDVNAQPEAPVNLRIPPMEGILENFSARPGVIEVDISSYGEGVLAEFVDGKLHLSQAEHKTVGRVFDKDLYSEIASELSTETSHQYPGTGSSVIDELIKKEVVYDDPEFSNHPYPPDLINDLDGDGSVELEGDALELKRVTRGSTFRTIELSDDNWTSVRLVTGRTDYPRATGGTQGPTVFVRGVVNGKASLAYDTRNSRLSDSSQLPLLILADHEATGDSLNELAADGPGVPGGLLYADPDIKTDPAGEGQTGDSLVLMSRGTIGAGGTGTYGKAKARDLDGNPFDYASELRQLGTRYENHYGTDGYERRGFHPTPLQHRSNLFGVFAASRIDFHTNFSPGGSFIPNYRGTQHPANWSRHTWNEYGSPPPGVNQEASPYFLLRMRNTRSYSIGVPFVKGAATSLDGDMRFHGGTFDYDYNLRSLSPETLKEEIGLPVSVVVCTWQRV